MAPDTCTRSGVSQRVISAIFLPCPFATTARYLRADDPEVRRAMRRVGYAARRLAVVPDEETG